MKTVKSYLITDGWGALDADAGKTVFDVEMPEGAKVTSVHLLGNRSYSLYVSAAVDPQAPVQVRAFHLVEEEGEFDEEGERLVGAFVLLGEIYHLYEMRKR